MEDFKAKITGTLIGPTWVVMCDQVAIHFDLIEVDGIGPQVVNPRTIQVHKAIRFQKDDAHRVAATIQNKNGSRGFAMQLINALDFAIDKQKQLLQLLVYRTEL